MLGSLVLARYTTMESGRRTSKGKEETSGRGYKGREAKGRKRENDGWHSEMRRCAPQCGMASDPIASAVSDVEEKSKGLG